MSHKNRPSCNKSWQKIGQKTLFQTWNTSCNDTISHATTSSNVTSNVSSHKPASSDFIDLCDDDDDDDAALVQAAEMEESLRESASSVALYTGSQSVDDRGFDRSAGHIYIYPTNYPVRQYQYDIVQSALFANTMVILPTGLGKTFIAAVVMYNYYRWYPRGKIIFMAPTKPLVAQQIEACYNIMGIPQAHTAEMTGESISWQLPFIF